MADIIMLDALFPPSNPDQLIADMNAVGAQACLVYCWRPGGIGNWTPAHVSRLKDAGKLVAASVVPFPGGGPIIEQLDAVRAMGINPPDPISADLEQPGLPPSSWEEAFDAEVHARGYRDFDYGTSSNLGLYQPDPGGEWIASWLRTGTLNPIPRLPGGWAAWQFVNDVVINGTQYDVSVVSQDVFTGVGSLGDIMTDAEQIASLTANVITAYVAFVHKYPTQDEIAAWVASARPYDPAGMVTRILSNLDAAGVPYVPDTDAQVLADIKAALVNLPPGPSGPPGIVDSAQVASLVKANLQKAADSL